MYKDIVLSVQNGVARITINRPEQYNAFRAETVLELIDAFQDAGWNDDVGVIVLGGAGEKAFCAGGDLEAKGNATVPKHRGPNGMATDLLHYTMRSMRKPVIARVQGYAIGGGNVLAAICDLTIASDRAKFGQAGPRTGSVDPGFGTAYLTRIVGEKTAREMWFLCRQYDAVQARQMGLCNVVVPHEELDSEVDKWCAEILEKSPTALAIAKRSFNASSDAIIGVGGMGWEAAMLYSASDDAHARKKKFLERKSNKATEKK